MSLQEHLHTLCTRGGYFCLNSLQSSLQCGAHVRSAGWVLDVEEMEVTCVNDNARSSGSRFCSLVNGARK